MALEQNSSLVQRVGSFHSIWRNYLGKREYDIQIRAETVIDFIRGRAFEHALDIGCGNGAVSLPLLMNGQCRRLTLVDVSANMLELAGQKVSPAFRNLVEFRNEDFMNPDFDALKYDLVLCIGVVEHVDSPNDLIAKIAKVLKPGGTLIFEVTDTYHPVGRLINFYNRSLNFVRSVENTLNRIWIRDILLTCQQHDLVPSAYYRYALPPPGSYKLFAQSFLYRVIRTVFGGTDHNRNRYLGNMFIYRLENNNRI